MIDLSKSLLIVNRTGKVTLGAKRTLETVRVGKAKLVVLASNCPGDVKKRIEEYAKLSEVPIVSSNQSSIDLGISCGKPFTVTALAVREVGDSDILSLVKGSNVE